MDTTQEKEIVEGEMDAVTSNTVSEEIVADVTPAVEAETPAVPFYKNKQMIAAIVIAVVLIVGAGGYYTYTKYFNDPTVAVVNGKKIHQTELTESLGLLEQSAAAQGIDTTTETAMKDLKDQAMTVLINNALLITAAEKASIKATDDDVQAKYDDLVKQLGSTEELTKRMEEIGLTEAKLRSNIKERILADAYIEANTPVNDLKVTDEEVNAFYTSISAGATDTSKLPALTDIRPQIEAEILNQKKQQLITDLLKKLHDEATIDLKV